MSLNEELLSFYERTRATEENYQLRKQVAQRVEEILGKPVEIHGLNALHCWSMLLTVAQAQRHRSLHERQVISIFASTRRESTIYFQQGEC
jgi:hypothetical protein